MELCRINADALVIGGGLAGLSAALELLGRGRSVCLVSKGKSGLSGNTIMARNSMAAVLREEPDTGTIREHIEDTLAGGAYLNDRTLVETLAEKAEEGIKQLMAWGVPFIREQGRIVLKGSPGHRMRRLLTVDASKVKSVHTSGLALSRPLLRRVEEAGARLVDSVGITRLLKRHGQVCGAYGLAKSRNEAWLFQAQAVILACGGAGQLFPLTTNAGDVSGDGYALGYLAGARLRDLEFIQFHPTVTLGPGKEVLSTASFGDGAVLRNREGEAFMSRYSPSADMATRDIMARAIEAEIKAGRGTEQGGVLVDFGAVPAQKLLREYALINSRLKGRTLIEVGTAAHFMVGGIEIDRGGHTGVPGLYACGEVAGGVHGGNRLAGNALTEAVVFGTEAARQAMRDCIEPVKPLGIPEVEEVFLADGIRLKEDLPWEKQTGSEKPADLQEIKKKLRLIMGEHVGLARSEQGLRKGKEEIKALREILDSYTPETYKALLAWKEIKLMGQTAALIADAAWKRRESIGAHYRLDF